jgi:hypothetical protein
MDEIGGGFPELFHSDVRNISLGDVNAVNESELSVSYKRRAKR